MPDPTRDRGDRLLERAFPDDSEFRDALLQVERVRRSQIVNEALAAAQDVETLLRIKSEIEEIRKRDRSQMVDVVVLKYAQSPPESGDRIVLVSDAKTCMMSTWRGESVTRRAPRDCR